MRRRPGITLLEVLVAIFIMAIGLLALLVLFPLGALSMADALKNDRTAAAAAAATELAETFDVRHDPNLKPAPPQSIFEKPTFVNWKQALQPTNPDGPGYPVLVDPAYSQFADNVGEYPPGAPTVTPGVPRIRPSYVPPMPPAAFNYATTRWFTLLDDMSFNPDGTPLLGSANNIQRGDRFTWAYLLRRPRSASDAVVDLTVVVFSSRPTALPTGETTFQASNTDQNGQPLPATEVLLTYTPPNVPNVKRGAWVLDTTYDTTGTAPPVHGYFYRVAGVTENPIAHTVTLELETSLKTPAAQPNMPTINAITVMENVAEVFDKGPGWAP
jgi:type II secretory pathway pseudopilin PulG